MATGRSVSLMFSWVFALTQTPFFIQEFVPRPRQGELPADPYAGRLYDLFRRSLRAVIRRTEDAQSAAGRTHVFVAAPKDVAQLVVGERNAGESVEAYRVQHTKERLLYFAPPRLVHVLEVGVFGQRGQVFLGGGAGVPAVLFGHLAYLRPYALVGILEHVVEECVEVLAEQLAQPVVRHRFMEQGLLGILHARMVGQHDGYLAGAGVVKPFGFRPSALQRGGVGHYFHV